MVHVGVTTLPPTCLVVILLNVIVSVVPLENPEANGTLTLPRRNPQPGR